MIYDTSTNKKDNALVKKDNIQQTKEEDNIHQMKKKKSRTNVKIQKLKEQII